MSFTFCLLMRVDYHPSSLTDSVGADLGTTGPDLSLTPPLNKALYLALAILLLACPVSGAEKIEGAFGFKLGQKFEPTTPLLKHEQDYNYHDVSPVTPSSPHERFATYYVRITPITHLVSATIAVGKPIPGDAGVAAD